MIWQVLGRERLNLTVLPVFQHCLLAHNSAILGQLQTERDPHAQGTIKSNKLTIPWFEQVGTLEFSIFLGPK